VPSRLALTSKNERFGTANPQKPIIAAIVN
jgi:hypothetical protein